MLAHDVDRGVTAVGMRSWADFITTPGPAADNQDGHRAVPQTQRAAPQPKFTLNPQFLASLFKSVLHTVLDPQGLHNALNPAPIVPPVVSPQQIHKGSPQGRGATQGKAVHHGRKGSSTPQPQHKKSGRYVPSPDSSSSAPSSLPDRVAGDNVAEENDLDRAGRLRVGALGVVRWILGTSDHSLLIVDKRVFVVSAFVFRMCPSANADHSESWPEMSSASVTDLPIWTTPLTSLAFWSTLHPATVLIRPGPVSDQLCPFSVSSFGQGQPQVRRAAWVLVGSLLRVFKGLSSLCFALPFVLYIHFGLSESKTHLVSHELTAHTQTFVVMLTFSGIR